MPGAPHKVLFVVWVEECAESFEHRLIHFQLASGSFEAVGTSRSAGCPTQRAAAPPFAF